MFVSFFPLPASHAYLKVILLSTAKGLSPGPQQGQQQPDPYAFASPFVPSEEAQKMMMSSYTEEDIARVSLEQMNEMSKRAQVAGMNFGSISQPQQQQLSNNAGAGGSGGSNGNGSVPISEPQPRLVGMSADDAMQRLSEISRVRASASSFDLNGQSSSGNASNGSGTFSTSGLDTSSASAPANNTSSGQRLQYPSYNDALAEYGQSGRNVNGAETSDLHAGLSVLTVGHLVPRPFGDPPAGLDPNNSNNQGWQFTSNHQQEPMRTQSPPIPPPASPPSLSGTDPRQLVTLDNTYPVQPPPAPAVPRRSLSTSPPLTPAAAKQRLRVRRSTFVPGWAVPPRVLLVEDDLVSRRLSSKFLQVSGCTIDVAVDGVGAVNKMNLEKYDLVLMVSCLLAAAKL